MYNYEDFLMFSVRYKPGIKSMCYTYYTPDLIGDEEVLSKRGDSVWLRYDPVGVLLKARIIETGQNYQFHYNQENLVAIEEYRNDELQLINNISYDTKGRIKEEIIREVKSKSSSNSQYIVYDYNHDEMTIRSYSYGISYDYLKIKRFNKLNQLVEEELIFEDGVTNHDKFVYNSKGERIKDIHYYNGKFQFASESVFSPNGLLKSSGENCYEYKFDHKGNYVERTQIGEFGRNLVLKREINYY